MDNQLHQRFALTDRSYSSMIKREVKKIAESCGFGAVETGKIDIIVNELTSNLVKHTLHGGEILVKPLLDEEKVGLEILCLDHGPGMRDPARMMEDGVSTAGSMGEGLGAIQRLSDEFDLYSQPDSGTVILSRLYRGGLKKQIKHSGRTLVFRSVLTALGHETVSGDSWGLFNAGDYRAVLAFDGLGHGQHAHDAAQSALAAFDPNEKKSPYQALQTIHEAIKKTRGAVGAIALIPIHGGILSFCGVGNITSRLFNPEKNNSLISYNGTLGYAMPTQLTNHTFAWNDSSVLIMHSDGLATKWDMGKYPQLLRHDASVVAAVLWKNHQRKTDDALVIVGKYQ